MPHTHTETQHSPYSPQQIFDLVADVAKYPEFLPWCRAARIVKRESPAVFYAELVIAYKGFSERYTSRVELDPEAVTIRAVMTEGPFHHLTNDWRFEPDGKGGTMIHFFLDFAFRSSLLERMLGGFFSRAAEQMASAFKQRAEKLYAQNR